MLTRIRLKMFTQKKEASKRNMIAINIDGAKVSEIPKILNILDL